MFCLTTRPLPGRLVGQEEIIPVTLIDVCVLLGKSQLQLKNKLCLEIFTGETPTAVYQDFFAGILLVNMASFALREQQEIIDEGDEHKDLKQSYQPNVSKLIYDIKTNLVALYSSMNSFYTVYYRLMCYKYIRRFAVHRSAKNTFPRFFGWHKSHRKSSL